MMMRVTLTLGSHDYPANHPYTHYRVRWSPSGPTAFLPNGTTTTEMDVPEGTYTLGGCPSNADGSQVDSVSEVTTEVVVVGTVGLLVPMSIGAIQVVRIA